MSSGGSSRAEGDAPVTVAPAALRRLRLAAAIGGVVGVALVAVVVWSLPRALAVDALVQENIALRQRVREVDARLGEIDRILLRLRGYEAQLRSLSADPDELPPRSGEPLGDHGPLPSGVGETELAAWRADVVARADGTLARAERAIDALVDADLDAGALAAEMEDLRALQRALPQVWPATGLLSSPYGYRRSPFGWSWKFHSGLDIAGDRGDPVFAAAPGWVKRAEYHTGYGRMLEIDHGYGITTLYGHNWRVVVEVGEYVEEGEIVATMGSTGRATGPHLHFELMFDGHTVDPLPYLPDQP